MPRCWWLISCPLSFVSSLKEDFYANGVERGVSYAVSSLLHYTILFIGFVLGAAALGVNFTQLSILAGALGVGIGFGLQSAVNNFVSGLILLFEQPIHVGDTVEIGDLLGEVRRIGMRASTVRTRTGADIIVPNAQLVTERVTNWTLGDQLRRIDLPVGLNYGVDPRKAIDLLVTVALARPTYCAGRPLRPFYQATATARSISNCVSGPIRSTNGPSSAAIWRPPSMMP